jgi:hypothetical protein
MDKKITVELDWDTIDKVTTCAMKSVLENLEVDLENRKKDKGIAVFDTNKKKDIAEIKRHIDAFKTVLKYFGESDA